MSNYIHLICVDVTHSADSSRELPHLHTTQTHESEMHASVVTEWPPASEVHASVVTGWPSACLVKLLTSNIKGQPKKTSKEGCVKRYQYLSYKPNSSFKPTLIFLKILFVAFKWYFSHKMMLIPGPHGKDRKYSGDRAITDNPNTNRGSPPLTAYRTSADCMAITPGPSIQHIHQGSTILGVSMLWLIRALIPLSTAVSNSC